MKKQHQEVVRLGVLTLDEINRGRIVSSSAVCVGFEVDAWSGREMFRI